MTWLLGEFEDLEVLPWYVQGVKQTGNKFKEQLEKKLNQFTNGIKEDAKNQYITLAEAINYCLDEALVIKK